MLWEITLGTAYFLGLKRTYRLALKIQRRLNCPKYPKIRQFVQRYALLYLSHSPISSFFVVSFSISCIVFHGFQAIVINFELVCFGIVASMSD